MRRREFITLLSGVAATWPLAADAQQSSAIRTVGFLTSLNTADAAAPVTAAFVRGLNERLASGEDRGGVARVPSSRLTVSEVELVPIPGQELI